MGLASRDCSGEEIGFSEGVFELWSAEEQSPSARGIGCVPQGWGIKGVEKGAEMSDKSIIIIGAGLAGLSAGCYAQMNGYRARIFEHHSKPGGVAA